MRIGYGVSSMKNMGIDGAVYTFASSIWDKL